MMYWGTVLPSSNGYKRKNTISRKYCLKFMSILFMRGRDKFQVNMSKLLWKTNPYCAPCAQLVSLCVM